MRLALLWALGLLGAGSPLTSRPLADIGEYPARSGRRSGEDAPGGGAGWRPAETPYQSAARPGSLSWPEGPAMEWLKKEGDAAPPSTAVILCSVPPCISRLRCWAPKGLAQQPLGMVGQGRCAPGRTSSPLWGLADHSTQCQGAEGGRPVGFGGEASRAPIPGLNGQGTRTLVLMPPGTRRSEREGVREELGEGELARKEADTTSSLEVSLPAAVSAWGLEGGQAGWAGQRREGHCGTGVPREEAGLRRAGVPDRVGPTG